MKYSENMIVTVNATIALKMKMTIGAFQNSINRSHGVNVGSHPRARSGFDSDD